MKTTDPMLLLQIENLIARDIGGKETVSGPVLQELLRVWKSKGGVRRVDCPKCGSEFYA